MVTPDDRAGIGCELRFDGRVAGSAGLTRVLATEGRPSGIQVNGVLPGAVTRAQRSTDESRSPSHEIDMSPTLVAPGVVWLVHEQCVVSGKFFATSSGRMGAVYTRVAEGYQAPDLKEWALDAARDNWQQIEASEPAIIAENARTTRTFASQRFARTSRACQRRSHSEVRASHDVSGRSVSWN